MDLISLGWCPDVPDFRDYVFSLPIQQDLPANSDLREPEINLFAELNIRKNQSCAASIMAMIDWQTRKWNGHSLSGSVEFLHQLTIKNWGGGGQAGISIRSALKTLKRYGAPPERICSSLTLKANKTLLNRPELYGFVRSFQDLRFIRIGTWYQQWPEKLTAMKSWLFHGNPFLIGFAVPHNLSTSSNLIPFDSVRGGTIGGSACVVMGYNDDYPTSAFKSQTAHSANQAICHSGAFLIRPCSDRQWGQQRYCWLPYAFVENHFASDAWGIQLP